MYTEYMYKDSLAHFGIKGQRWGVRRYQNPDGSLTPEGKARYGIKDRDSDSTKAKKRDLASNMSDRDFKKKYGHSKAKYMKSLDQERSSKKETFKKVAKVAGTAALAGGAAYLGHKYLKNSDLSSRLADYELDHGNAREAKKIIDMNKNHPLTFDKKIERENLHNSIVGRYQLAYKRAKNEYRANPTEQNKKKLEEATDRYIGFHSHGMSTKELRKLENISKQYTSLPRNKTKK